MKADCPRRRSIQTSPKMRIRSHCRQPSFSRHRNHRCVAAANVFLAEQPSAVRLLDVSEAASSSCRPRLLREAAEATFTCHVAQEESLLVNNTIT